MISRVTSSSDFSHCHLSLVCPLARLTAILDSDFGKTEISISLRHHQALAISRLPVFQTSFLIFTAIHMTCWPFCPRMYLLAFIDRLLLWSSHVMIRFQLGLFSTSFLTFFFSQPSLDLIVLGTWEQPPNLLCQMFPLFMSVKPYFLKWSFCLTHDQSLKHCLPLEKLFCGLFW